jgi:hypothetical protein
MAHFARDSDRSAPGADGVPGVRRTSYYLELQQQDGIFLRTKTTIFGKRQGWMILELLDLGDGRHMKSAQVLQSCPQKGPRGLQLTPTDVPNLRNLPKSSM